jgi:hypothetical protein
MHRFLLAFHVAILSLGCGTAAPRELSDLVIVDSVYVDPASMEAFTGAVVRHFEGDSSKVEISGALLEGSWDGEFTVYHPNGRVRYMGAFEEGDRCGPWVENADSLPTESAYEDLVREVESMGLYPPCDESS